MILFGHPTGSPFSHHAALAHLEAGRLAAFCVPWMPSAGLLALLAKIPSLRRMGARLARRRFEALADAPMIQGRLGEWRRLLIRALGHDHEGLAYEANDWLMDTMAIAAHRGDVTIVHSYEDCSLRQFEAARHLGKRCLYDLPIGYYPAWEDISGQLLRRHADWVTADTKVLSPFARPEQKRKEMELADLVLVPSEFVRQTVEAHTRKEVVVVPYGVDVNFWRPPAARAAHDELRFLFAGSCSLRKGLPLLLEAWQKAAPQHATLKLLGSWPAAEARRKHLPAGVTWEPPTSATNVCQEMGAADVFVFPSYFEGRALVVGEALACGLPVITSDASGWSESVDESSGRVVKAGDLEQLIEALRWFAAHRHQLPAMSRSARACAERHSWDHYRTKLNAAVSSFV